MFRALGLGVRVQGFHGGSSLRIPWPAAESGTTRSNCKPNLTGLKGFKGERVPVAISIILTNTPYHNGL